MLAEFDIHSRELRVRETGKRIPVNRTFLVECARIAGFTMEISAISAARAARARLAQQQSARRLRIGFTPHMPQFWYAIWPVCHLAGIEIVRNPEDADILFYFEDNEFSPGHVAAPAGKYMLNGECLNIRKSRVGNVFADVFGYGLNVDPFSYSGLALMKSERNGVHDGQITPCPYVVPRAGSVFQRLIENTTDGRVYTDIRTPVVGGAIPVIYLKQRTSATRFSNDNINVELSTAQEQFSAEEIARIGQFCRRIGLDFGGLDILRDRKDGRIYIVDVNKTDMGPPTALARPKKLLAMQKLADAFRAYVEPLAESGSRAA